MPNIINAEHNTPVTMTITLAYLAEAGARQSDMVNNNDNGQMIRVFFKVTTGTSPTDNKTIEFYLLTADKHTTPNIITDGAGASDAGITINTAQQINIVSTDNVSDKEYEGSFLIRNPGASWGIAVKNNTGVILNSTGGNHQMTYVIENQEIQ